MYTNASYMLQVK